MQYGEAGMTGSVIMTGAGHASSVLQHGKSGADLIFRPAAGRGTQKANCYSQRRLVSTFPMVFRGTALESGFGC